MEETEEINEQHKESGFFSKSGSSIKDLESRRLTDRTDNDDYSACEADEDCNSAEANADPTTPSRSCLAAIPNTPCIAEANLTDTRHHVDESNFIISRLLGTGAYGAVFLVRKQGGADHNQVYAMKVLKKHTLVVRKKTAAHTMTERQVLEAVRDAPFLATLHYAFQTDDMLHLVMDFTAGGELFARLHKYYRFSEYEVRFYCAEMILALETLHKLGVLYRDIKLENILIGADGHLVLTDFGLSKIAEVNERAQSYCGTMEYMAPDVVDRESPGYSYSADYWSIGVLCCEMLVGKCPFLVKDSDKIMTEREIQEEVTSNILYGEPEIPSTMSPDFADFIRKLLVKNPTRRLGGFYGNAEEIKSHQLFKNLDWNALARKEIRPPFVPTLSSDDDVRYFSKEFTNKRLSEISLFNNSQPITQPMNEMFKGYSFISPSVRNSSNSSRPSVHGIKECRKMKTIFFEQYDVNLEEDGLLGEGTYSLCFKCLERSTRDLYAVKIIKRFNILTSQEVSMLTACQGHPNIVRVHQIFNDSKHTYFVLERLEGGELFEQIHLRHHFTEADARRIFLQLVDATNYMHGKGIVHRDLKPENILFTGEEHDPLRIKIVDFGFAQVKEETSPTLKTPVYTKKYAAPEVILNNGTGYDGKASDLWSLGIILYTMLSGEGPFWLSTETYTAAIERIKNGTIEFKNEVWSSVSEEAKDLIKDLLKVDPKIRMKMTDLLENTWLVGYDNGVEQAFSNSPQIGFKLQTVNMAQLCQRRRQKKSNTRSSSNASDGRTPPQGRPGVIPDSEMPVGPITRLKKRKLGLELFVENQTTVAQPQPNSGKRARH